MFPRAVQLRGRELRENPLFEGDGLVLAVPPLGIQGLVKHRAGDVGVSRHLSETVLGALIGIGLFASLLARVLPTFICSD
jgi:hypothetical protein